jgi:outer membrane protein
MVILRTFSTMAKSKSIIITVLAMLFLNLSAKAQNVWDLKRCIEYAISKNITVQQNNLQVDVAQTNINQSWATLAPSVNGSANQAWNIGRRIDPFTNTFANSSVRSNNFNVSANLNLFSGLTSINTIKQNQTLLAAAKFDNEKLRNDISVNVALAFLQVVFAEEQVKNFQNALDLTTQQVNRNQILFDAGTIAQGVLLDLQAQQANDEVNLISAQNTLDIAKLNLVQLLNLTEDESKDLKVSVPAMDTIPTALASDIAPASIFTEASKFRPEMLASETRVKSNRLGVSIARGNYYPQLSAFGAYGTGYSQLQQTVTGTQTQIIPIGVTQSGEVVYTQTEIPTTALTPFGTQLTNNVNKTFGFSLNVPIFNGLQVRTAVSKAKINYEISKLSYDQTALTLRKDIEQAFYDARAAYKKYIASKKSEEAATLAFKFSTDRFNAGMLNAVDYAATKNTLTLAQSNLLQAKYDYIFKSKLLDFYRGKPLY